MLASVIVRDAPRYVFMERCASGVTKIIERALAGPSAAMVPVN